MPARIPLATLTALSLALAVACGGAGNDVVHEAAGPSGTLQAALTFPADDDVEGLLFEISQGGVPVDSRYVALEGLPLPAWLLPIAGAGGYDFSDSFFVLAPGVYDITVTPMQDPATPSAECAPVSGQAEVFDGITTEIVLVSQCDTAQNGALDVVGVLNHQPVIDGFDFDPSKFIYTCDPQTLVVTASDPDGDELVFEWEVLDAPAGAAWDLTPDEDEAEFITDHTEGDYLLRVTATDPFGLSAELTFPVHVMRNDALCDALVCPPGQLLVEAPFIGDHFNLDCNHPDVEGPITGVVPGTLPGQFDWFTPPYYAFTAGADLLDTPANFFPVDEGLCDDPFYFGIHWETTMTVYEENDYTFRLGADDDAWLFVDGNLVIDLGGIHPLTIVEHTAHLLPGEYDIDLWFAERHFVQSGLTFSVNCPPVTFHASRCVDDNGDLDADGALNDADADPLDPNVQ